MDEHEAFIPEKKGVQDTLTFVSEQKLQKQKLRSSHVGVVLECMCNNYPPGKFDTDRIRSP